MIVDRISQSFLVLLLPGCVNFQSGADLRQFLSCDGFERLDAPVVGKGTDGLDTTRALSLHQ